MLGDEHRPLVGWQRDLSFSATGPPRPGGFALRAAVAVQAGIGRIGQDGVDRIEACPPPADDVFIRPAVGQRHLLLDQVGGHVAGGTELGKLGEDQADGLLHGFVRQLDDAALAIVLETDRQMRAQLAAASRLPQATRQACMDEVQFDLTHRPFESEQEPVIENSGGDRGGRRRR